MRTVVGAARAIMGQAYVTGMPGCVQESPIRLKYGPDMEMLISRDV